MAEKASLHKGKISGQTGEKHLERDFDYERVESHIDPSKTYLNVVKSFCPGKGTELEFYEERYRMSLDIQNGKYVEKRNYDRIRTMEEIYETSTKRPTEEIIQYSKHDGVKIPPEIYNEIVECYVSKLREWGKAHGNHFHVLKYANHFDEEKDGSIHTHIRTIWDYEDENGVVCIGQEEGMRQAGLDIPDIHQFVADTIKADAIKEQANQYVIAWDEKRDDEGNVIARKPIEFSDKEAYEKTIKKARSAKAAVHRFNNRSITWTKMQRDMWEETLEEFGYACDKQRISKQKHQSKQAWAEELEELRQEEIRLRDEAKALCENQQELIQTEAYNLVRTNMEEMEAIALQKVKCEYRQELERELESIRSEVDEQRKIAIKLKSENMEMLDDINNNSETVKMIQQGDLVIKHQQEKIAENRKTLEYLKRQIEVMEKGNAITKNDDKKMTLTYVPN